MNWIKEEMAEITNKEGLRGDLAEAVAGRDVFIGLSAPGVLTKEMVASMAPEPIIFALANPTPEIWPDDALEAGARIVATGRSDLPNQVNNSLAFPGIFRGALDTRVRNITDEMKIAAAQAIAGLVSDRQLRADYIIPRATDYSVRSAVAEAVARTALESGEARQHCRSRRSRRPRAPARLRTAGIGAPLPVCVIPMNHPSSENTASVVIPPTGVTNHAQFATVFDPCLDCPTYRHVSAATRCSGCLRETASPNSSRPTSAPGTPMRVFCCSWRCSITVTSGKPR
jgi:hypothetical protein